MFDRTTPIYTDLDDVAFDWTGGFKRAVEPLLGRTLTDAPDSWDFSAWLGVDNPIDYIRAFNASEAFGRLEPLPCAVAVLRAAARAGHPIFGITAQGDDPISHQRRHENITLGIGPIFEDVRFVPLGGDKSVYLRDFVQRHGKTGLWIEDNPHHALVGADLGLTTFVRRQPHNRDFERDRPDPRLTWIDDYHEVGRFLGLAPDPSS